MGDALKGRRLLIAAAVAVAILAGLGAAAQAGLLSRAEAGQGEAKGAGAAIGSPETGDVIAAGESSARAGEGEGPPSASTTVLRVGDTKIGESTAEHANPLADLLDGQPTEALIDGGCNDGLEVPLCVYALQSIAEADPDGGDSRAVFSAAGVRAGNTGIAVLNSEARQDFCGSRATGSLAFIIDLETFEQDDVDPSEASYDNPECNIG